MLRVALISQVQPAVRGIDALLRSLGHQPVGLLCTRSVDRYGLVGEHVVSAPPDLDVVIPANRNRIAPLLRALEPDVVVCAAFPWLLPPDALEVAPLGVVNFHPSLLPRYRGPIPVAWAIREGETEFGVTFHRMEPDLDTGPILAQGTIRLEDEHSWEELQPKLGATVGQLLPAALERVERGELGDPQREEDASYYGFFEPEYVEIDWSRSRAEIARQVRAWRFATTRHGDLGALTELDGQRVRVLRVSLEESSGRRVECGDGALWILESEPA